MVERNRIFRCKISREIIPASGAVEQSVESAQSHRNITGLVDINIRFSSRAICGGKSATHRNRAYDTHGFCKLIDKVPTSHRQRQEPKAKKCVTSTEHDKSAAVYSAARTPLRATPGVMGRDAEHKEQGDGIGAYLY
jgi:hypothetical protein